MNLNDKKLLIVKKLIAIRDEEDYILGILSDLKTEEQVDKMLEYMEEEHTVPELIVAAIYFSEGLA